MIKSEAQNARLEAEVKALKLKEFGPSYSDWLNANYIPKAQWVQEASLCDLLAPTIELELRVARMKTGHLIMCQCERCVFARALESDAARLRARTEGKV